MPGAVSRSFAAAVLLLVGLRPFPAEALDPAKRITQYVFDSWQLRDGLPVSGVRSIAQTPDGYMWFGTEEGLVRFDGVRFTTFARDDRQRPFTIDSMLVDHDGALWLGTTAGLVLWKHGVAASYTTRDGLAHNAVRCLYEDRQHVIWVCTRGGLSRFDRSRFTTYTRRDGLPHETVNDVVQGRDGSFWIGAAEGLSRWKDDRFQVFTTSQGLASNAVQVLLEDRAGTLWAAAFEGLTRIAGADVRTFTSADGLPPAAIRDLEEDRSGSLWISTHGGGLARLREGRIERFTKEHGLAGDLLRDIHLDHHGALWLSTSYAGIGRLKDSPFTAYTTREGLGYDPVRAVLEGRDGSVWVATHGGGLSRIGQASITTYTVSHGLLSDVVFALHADRSGRLWIGSYNGGLNIFQDGRFVAVASEHLPRHHNITAILQDRSDNVWITTWGGGLKRYAAGAFTTFTTRDGLSSDYLSTIIERKDGSLWVGGRDGLTSLAHGRFARHAPPGGWSTHDVSSLYEDHDATLWIGSSGRGLVRFKGGEFTAYTTDEGLFDNTVFSILDEGGRLWMSSNRGVWRVSKLELNELAEGKRTAITSVSYGVADGMKAAECNGGSQPAAWRGQDGRMWFATARGAVVVHPSAAVDPIEPVQVLVEEVLAEGRVVSRAGEMAISRVPAGSQRFEFHYTAPDRTAPERLQFRYRLDGVDDEWIEAGTRRVAYYTRLPPGAQRFRVEAVDRGQPWTAAGAASFGFTLQPHFYQTWWFYGMCATAVGAALWAGHRVRLKQVLDMERIRTRIASDLHDDIGSSLSQIAILSEVAHAIAAPDTKVLQPLQRIARLSRESIDAMSDIVWAVDPHRNMPSDLAARMRRFASDMLPPRGIELDFDARDEASPSLNPELRRQVYLVFKEAVSNIVRHSEASRASIQLAVSGTRLRLRIEDNGRGFSAGSERDGLGLRTMTERAKRLGGTLDLVAADGEGVRLDLSVPV